MIPPPTLHARVRIDALQDRTKKPHVFRVAGLTVVRLAPGREAYPINMAACQWVQRRVTQWTILGGYYWPHQHAPLKTVAPS